MKDAEEQIDLQCDNAEFATTVTDKEGVMENHPERQQFVTPLLSSTVPADAVKPLY